MQKWPPFDQAFPALAGEWDNELEQAVVEERIERVREICASLGILCSLIQEVPRNLYVFILWLLRSEEVRSTETGEELMQFFVLNHRDLSRRQTRAMVKRFTNWGRPDMVEYLLEFSPDRQSLNA